MAELLDADGPDTLRLTVADATALCLGALGRLGYADGDAQIITGQLVDNALCGYRYAGLPRLMIIAQDKKAQQGRVPVRIVHETPRSALLDGGNNVGYLGAYRGAEVAIAKARASGIASVGVYNSYYSGRNAYYVEKIVREGFIALHTASSEPRVLPPGATAPALGTNPICFGFPSAQGPVTIDMGTAAMMVGDLRLHALLGQALPAGIAFDRHGAPTRDAGAALEGGVLPFGGHKGYGLSFAIQALGLLAGAAQTRGAVQDFAFLFWVIDPKIMLPGADFAQLMSDLVRSIKATPRRPGVDEIRIPSERAARERELRCVQGIVIERRVIAEIEAL
jgi:LDH2 family malate/lactate/ureidoglycolate dehydrogenase